MKKVLIHIKTILIHKWWVLYYSIIMRNFWRGLIHDMSKFHPIEFIESLDYVDGKSSPIPRCKKDKGYSLAWLHHKSHNKHHFEYWIDFNNGEINPIEMPYKYVKEMVADWLAAGRTYKGKSFNIQDEYGWLQSNNMIIAKLLHPSTNLKVREIMEIMKEIEDSNFFMKIYKFGKLQK